MPVKAESGSRTLQSPCSGRCCYGGYLYCCGLCTLLGHGQGTGVPGDTRLCRLCVVYVSAHVSGCMRVNVCLGWCESQVAVRPTQGLVFC